MVAIDAPVASVGSVELVQVEAKVEVPQAASSKKRAEARPTAQREETD